jgi:hypothetical protein
VDDLPDECQQQEHTRESRKAYAAFLDYCRMGPGRSYAKLVERYQKVPEPSPGSEEVEQPPTRRLPTIKDWAVRFEWQKRLEAWDDWQQARKQEKWEQRRDELREADWGQGQKLRERVEEILEELPKFIRKSAGEKDGVKVVTVKLNATLTQIAQALTHTSNLQRMAAGAPASSSCPARSMRRCGRLRRTTNSCCRARCSARN